MPHTAQKPAQVRKYCQERTPGGGQIRLLGTAADQAAPANDAMRMATATPKRMLDISGRSYRFGFGATAASSTRFPSESFATPCGSPGVDHVTAPGPSVARRCPTAKLPSPSIT